MKKLINIGCGTTYHPDWINLDVSPVDPKVLSADIAKGLPFPADFASVCYSSHVLEHFDVVGARNLVSECFRVLTSGGVIRLAVPDLEALAREYLQALDDVGVGNSAREADYDWLMLELYDQPTRRASGGEMARFLASLDEKKRGFVRTRIGAEAERFWAPRQVLTSVGWINWLVNRLRGASLVKRIRMNLAGWLVYLIAGKAALKSFKMGVFRSSGEVHQWMYDRYSLTRLLEQSGFVDIKICAAGESRIPEFEKYSLDVSDGVVRKPDSIFVEASKP